ncbi:MAG: hypothetical protein HRT46_08720 [Deltaproteobacteria bacterium]|nr:hypothetical protein [Deltaproteobacteria bacterium]
MRNSRRVSDAVLLCLTLSLAACTSMRQVGADDIVLQNTIRWATASESNNFGFDVYRGDSTDGSFERLTKRPIQGAMETDVPQQYEFVDDTIKEGKTYYYYVESISLNNVRKRFTPVLASKPKHRRQVD